MRKKQNIICEPNLFLTAKCNQKCIYCSADGEDRVMNEKELSDCLDIGYKTLAFEGGEPLMSDDLEIWVQRAKKSGAKDIILLTNGLLLTDKKINSLVKKGVAKFEFNFPSHIEKIHDVLTGAEGKLGKKIKIIKRAIKRLKHGVIITFVLNSLNYKTLPAYIDFVSKEFPEVFFVAVNFIKIKGLVKKRKYLIPKLIDARPYVIKALVKAKKIHVPVIVDGFPLCVLDGCEEYSRDIDRIIKGDDTYLGEKNKVKKCLKCGLKDICAGPRKDYREMFGDAEITPSKKKSANIIKKVKKGQLQLNAKVENGNKKKTR